MHAGLECSKHNNPADFFLDKINEQEKEYDEEKGEGMWYLYSRYLIMCHVTKMSATPQCVY